MTHSFLTRYRRAILLTGILLITSTGSVAQQIFTFSDKDSVEAGEIIEITFVIQGNYTSIDPADNESFPDEVEVISRQRYQVAANRDSLVYQLQFFGTEDLVLPSVPFRLQMAGSDTTLNSSRIPIYFKSLLSENEDAFRPFKPVFDFARDIWPYLLSIILIVLIAYYIYRWFKSRETKHVPVPAPDTLPYTDPLEQLKNTLDKLPAPESLCNFDEFESFYVKLGDAIRRYIKKVYLFPALEMTTREICFELDRELAPSSTVKITRTVLNEADMVKFANFKPDSELASNVLRLAKDFYDQARTNDIQRIERLKLQHELNQDRINNRGNGSEANNMNELLPDEPETIIRKEKP